MKCLSREKDELSEEWEGDKLFGLSGDSQGFNSGSSFLYDS